MATSKTMSSVSNSNKPNTNKESVSYLVFGTNSDGNLDTECYLVVNDPKATVLDIVNKVHSDWDDYSIGDIRVLAFKHSQIKRIKQTLELV